jgi:hypothetical protein
MQFLPSFSRNLLTYRRRAEMKICVPRGQCTGLLRAHVPTDCLFIFGFTRALEVAAGARRIHYSSWSVLASHGVSSSDGSGTLAGLDVAD